jgi:hypothetical protein
MMPVWLNCNENEKKQTYQMTNKLFLSAKSWIFTSAILWGADNKIKEKDE